MTVRVRSAWPDDLEGLFALAAMTEGGITNLPADKDALAEKLARSAAAFARGDVPPEDELYLIVAEDCGSGELLGTAQIFSRIGVRWPFYSYRLTALTQSSRELGRTFRAEMLNLVTDFEGATEVGGLFLKPGVRASGMGGLLARSRYLFIARHRVRFGKIIMAELRGWLDESGESPFWAGLGEKFFGMRFQEADAFNALHGNQFIADLMPKYPVYTALLSDEARAVIGRPHDSGAAAMAMLIDEGFRYDGYIDIFDGGPALSARIDELRTVGQARNGQIRGALGRDEGRPAIIASGDMKMINATFANMRAKGRDVLVNEDALTALGLTIGDDITYALR